MESPPLSRFLRALGKVQHHLHTMIVGLSAVEKGIAVKPDDLDISWTAYDLVGSVRETRRYMLRTTLIFAAEELNEYAKCVLRYRAIVMDDKTFPKHRADRIRALAEPDVVDPSYLSVAPLIVSHWRNRIVHRDSKTRLSSAEEQRLRLESESVRENFKNVDVARLLQDFEIDRPTLKDVTVLLAMCIRFVKQADSTLPPADTPERVRRWLEADELLTKILSIEKESINRGCSDARRRGKQFLLTEAPALAEPYYAHGICE